MSFWKEISLLTFFLGAVDQAKCLVHVLEIEERIKRIMGHIGHLRKMAIYDLPVTVGLSRLCCLKPHGYCFLNHHKISTRINSNICVLRKVSHLIISNEHVVFSALLQKKQISNCDKNVVLILIILNGNTESQLNFQQLDLFYLSQYGENII